MGARVSGLAEYAGWVAVTLMSVGMATGAG
jgi:hypothetical protein